MFSSIATVIVYSLLVLFPVLVPAAITLFGAIAESVAKPITHGRTAR